MDCCSWLLLAGAMQASAQTAPPSEAKPAGEALQITTIPLTDVWFKPLKRVPAVALSLNHAQISAQANGEVLRLAVEVGDSVSKGDLLVELDCRVSKLSEAVLNDVLELARSEYSRAQTLQKSRTIADQEIKRLQSSLEQARIRIKQAELSVENCRVTAPFDGVVTERQVQLGMLATPGLALLTLLQLDALEVEVQLSSDELRSLQESDEISFVVDEQSYPLALRAVLPLLDRMTNKRTVRLKFTSQAPLPGSSGDLSWPAAGHYLPADLLVERDAKLGYFVVEEGRAKFRVLEQARIGHPARLGPQSKAPQDVELVRDGRFGLQQGDRVEIRGAPSGAQ